MEKQLPFDMVVEAKYAPTTPRRRLNPAGELPVLEEDGGLRICGNYPITEYLEEAYPQRTLLPRSMPERVEVRRLIDWFDKLFNREVTQKLVQEKIYLRQNPDLSPSTHALREGKRNIGRHLEMIASLTQDQPWLTGESMTLADITAAAHISSLDYLGDVPWKDYPQSKDWYALMKSRPAFQWILRERLPGIHPPPYYENPDF
jgi:glutathione S-transferase